MARRHLATEGANLSLRAVAREMGMVSSALYRYFSSRDELLTALIIDAYDAMGEAAEAADAAVADRADLAGRWRAVARAVRRWSLDHPAEYALLYGSPVPGYAAPTATVEPSARPIRVLSSILADGRATRRLARVPSVVLPAALRDEIRHVADEFVVPGFPVSTMARALLAWTELFGAISFDVFGRLNNAIDERDDWFDYQTAAMIDYLGLQ